MKKSQRVAKVSQQNKGFLQRVAKNKLATRWEYLVNASGYSGFPPAYLKLDFFSLFLFFQKAFLESSACTV